MRIARVIGNITLGRRLDSFPVGRLVIADVLDHDAIAALPAETKRVNAMPEALIVFDQLGAGDGQLIGVSEGREASMPWWPEKAPVDAYATAILDNVELTR